MPQALKLPSFSLKNTKLRLLDELSDKQTRDRRTFSTASQVDCSYMSSLIGPPRAFWCQCVIETRTDSILLGSCVGG